METEPLEASGTPADDDDDPDDDDPDDDPDDDDSDDDLDDGSIHRHLIRFAIPLMLGNLFQLSYNMVDTVVIGRFAGSVSLAAVGTCDQIMNLLILGVSGVCLGASVLMGNFFGAGAREKLLDELKTVVSIGLLFSGLVLALGLPCSGLIFRLMRVQPEAMADASRYLRIIFVGMPFTCLYNVYAAALRSVGDARTPTRFLILSCVINALLDLLLVAVCHWGVLGVALACIIGWSAMLCWTLPFRRRFSRRRLTQPQA